MPDNRETAQTLGDSSHEAAPRSHTRRPARSPGAGDAAFALRFVVVPIVEYVLKLAAKYPERKIAVAIPEFVEDRWYEYFLHNQRARLLQWVLLARGTKQIYTVASPYYLSDSARRLAGSDGSKEV